MGLKRTVLLFLICALASGCSKVRHLDQLLTLKALAEEQDQINKDIEAYDQNFDLMLAEAKAGTLDQYAEKRKIERTFGEPVFSRNVTVDERELESCLYRRATEYFGADKIYLYFDNDGNLIKSEYIEGDHGEGKQETAAEDGQQEI